MKKKVLIPVLCLGTVLVLGALGIILGTRDKAESGVTRCLLIGCDRFVSMPGTEPASANNVDTMEALEDSWFWNTETDEYTGTGYFTAAMDRALRASDPEQIDPDGSGGISLAELTERLREIHGASRVYCYPEESTEGLFRLPADRKTGSHLQGVAFGAAVRDGDAVILPIRYRAGEPVRVMYQLVPGRNGKWDFEHAVRLPDKEKTGLIRGLVSPGEKERKIRLTVGNIGEDGRALMQIVCFAGDTLIPSVEAGTVIAVASD